MRIKKIKLDKTHILKMQSRTYIKQVLNRTEPDTVILTDRCISSKIKIKDNVRVNTPEERGLTYINGIKWVVPTSDTKHSLTGINFMEDKSGVNYIAISSLKAQIKQKAQDKQEHEDLEIKEQLKEDQKAHYTDFINKMEIRKQLEEDLFNISLAYKNSAANLKDTKTGEDLNIVAFKPLKTNYGDSF